MAVAWTKDKVGRAVGDVTIRDPVVLTATLPRFLLNGDRATMHLDLDNVEGPAGDYAVELAARGPIDVVGKVVGQSSRCAPSSAARVRCRSTCRPRAPATVTVHVSGPGGFALERSYALTRAAGDADS